MPKEKFYPATAVEGDGSEPTLTISWGHGPETAPGVFVNSVDFDRSALNRLIRVLRLARDNTFGADE